MKKIKDIKVFNNISLLAAPFIIMDIVIRILSININYSEFSMVLPSILFNVIWIFLFVGISVNLKKNMGRIVYGLFFIVFYVMFLTNSIYYLYTGFFFNFNLLLLADQAQAYMSDVLLNTNPIIYLVSLFILAAAVYAIIKFPEVKKSDIKNIGVVLCFFVVLHLIIPLLMGKYEDSLKWDNWRSPRNVYETFNDSNKNVKICGLYEYSVRDFYITFLKQEKAESEEDLKYLDEVYSAETIHEKNEYTGLFEGKNVIFLQLEGLDSWLLNDEDMPNLYGLLKNSIVFDNHYSYYNGGGSTFNSELAVNTGFITPISYNKNAYMFNSNLFTHSLPKLLKERGYSVNAFHMNTGEYYSRELNYLNWGYDNYYGLLDENEYSDARYELDRELILNDGFYEKMFKSETPFMHYIITYTPHTPFTLDSKMGKLLSKEYFGKEESVALSEEECARLFAAETDYMVELLMKALEDNGLMDNTIIVAYADHYLYTLNDKTILDKYKETENNLINYTPFFIWSNNMQQVVSDKVNSQIDILPTVLNLLGIEYIQEHYIGNDIFDPDYTGYTFFSDRSWYDGSIYVEEGRVVSGDGADEKYVTETNQLINNLIMQNDLTLKYDYFRRKEN